MKKLLFIVSLIITLSGWRVMPVLAQAGLAATAVSDSGVNLTWSPTSTTQQIQRSTDGGQTWFTIRTTGPNDSTWNDTSLWAGLPYEYRLNVGPTVSVTTLPVPTGALATPTNLAATVNNPTSATISWTDPNAGIHGYEYFVERSTDGGLNYQGIGYAGTQASGPWTDAQQTPGATYFYRIRALSGGQSASGYSLPISVTLPGLPVGTPNAPTGTTAVNNSATSTTISWSDTNAGGTAYEIFRSAWAFSPGSFHFAKIATTPAGATSYTDSTCAAETPYAYYVKAINAATSVESYPDVTINVTTASPGTGNPKVYDVGPGQTFPTIGSFNWRTLGPGDTIRVHGNGTIPYPELLLLTVRGTAASPITIEGVPDASGAMPIIDATNAVQNAQFAYAFKSYGSIGCITTYRTPTSLAAYRPGYLIIQGFELRNCYAGDEPAATKYTVPPIVNTWTDYTGASQNFTESSMGIYLLTGDNITIQNCVVHGNGEGIFFAGHASYDRYTANIVLRDNYLYGNGNDNSFSEHESYGEGVNTLYEGNRYGPGRPGSGGGALKDRSDGVTIRYNYIENSARVIDRVEAQNEAELSLTDPQYQVTNIYGNILLIDSTNPGCNKYIHYGGDSLPGEYFPTQPLNFWGNTIVCSISQKSMFDVLLFDLSTPAQTVDARNNIIANEVPGGGAAPEFDLLPAFGVSSFGPTWASQGTRTNFSGNKFTGMEAGASNIINGPGADPGFNGYPADFTLASTSPAIGKSGPLSAEMAAAQFTGEYANQSVIARASTSDLGALASSAPVVIPPPPAPTPETITITGTNPASLTQGDIGDTMNLQAANNVAPWSVTTPFSLSAGTITHVSVTPPSTTILTFNAPAVVGPITVTDGVASATVNIGSVTLAQVQALQQSLVTSQANLLAAQNALQTANQASTGLQAQITALQAQVASLTAKIATAKADLPNVQTDSANAQNDANKVLQDLSGP